jgi:hypothetical protein
VVERANSLDTDWRLMRSLVDADRHLIGDALQSGMVGVNAC